MTYENEKIKKFLCEIEDFSELPYDEQLDAARKHLGKSVSDIKEVSHFVNEVTKYRLKKAALRAAVPAIMIRKKSKSLGLLVLQKPSQYQW